MKKRPAKKTAHTPKRKYKPRKKPDEIGGGVDQIAEQNDVQLLQLEKVDMQSLGRSPRLGEESAKMEELLRKMKVKEGFVIKKSWVKYVFKIVADAQLKIVIRTFRVEGNLKFRKVVRLT